jgi:uroporphyrinogen III methyltransferase / synthase
MTLRGLRILVTRSGGPKERFSAMIRDRGGTPVSFPTVRMVPPRDSAPLDGAIDRLASFHWLLFTSGNAARFFLERAAARGVGRLPDTLRVASVGPGTSREIRERGFPVHLAAGKHTAEGLVEALAAEGIRGKRFLFPRAESGREVLPEEIARRGGAVETVTAYRNEEPPADEGGGAAILADPPDVCTFASPSAFRNFFLRLGEEAAASVLSRSRIAVIGEVTAAAVSERKFRVDILPERYTLAGMLEAIERHNASRAPREEGQDDLS